jgi:hypothetical protein
VPRLLERFAHFGIHATFFVVARDAEARAATLRALAEAGHEVASHSLTHPPAFASLPADRLQEELRESKRLLESAVGREVAGFRAPHFDLRSGMLAAVAGAGYRYDASGYPTPLLAAARLALAVRGDDPLGALSLTAWPFTLRRAPHAVQTGGRELLEFPAAVTPLLRLPVYHTLRFVTARAAFANRLAGFAARGESLSYTLHAVDALGLAEDGVDPRLRSHPGMAWPLARKLAALDDVLEGILRRYEPRTFRERLADA